MKLVQGEELGSVTHSKKLLQHPDPGLTARTTENPWPGLQCDSGFHSYSHSGPHADGDCGP